MTVHLHLLLDVINLAGLAWLVRVYLGLVVDLARLPVQVDPQLHSKCSVQKARVTGINISLCS